MCRLLRPAALDRVKSPPACLVRRAFAAVPCRIAFCAVLPLLSVDSVPALPCPSTFSLPTSPPPPSHPFPSRPSPSGSPPLPGTSSESCRSCGVGPRSTRGRRVFRRWCISRAFPSQRSSSRSCSVRRRTPPSSVRNAASPSVLARFGIPRTHAAARAQRSYTRSPRSLARAGLGSVACAGGAAQQGMLHTGKFLLFKTERRVSSAFAKAWQAKKRAEDWEQLYCQVCKRCAASVGLWSRAPAECSPPIPYCSPTALLPFFANTSARLPKRAYGAGTTPTHSCPASQHPCRLTTRARSTRTMDSAVPCTSLAQVSTT